MGALIVDRQRPNTDSQLSTPDYQLPQAVIRLKQGFGRLIRTRSDTGMVVILDPRVLTKAYGKAFLDALPPCRTFVDGVARPEMRVTTS